MPRLNHRPRRRRRSSPTPVWNKDHRYQLRVGFIFDPISNGFVVNDPDMLDVTGNKIKFLSQLHGEPLKLARQCWKELKDKIMAEHIAEKPGTRPEAWWLWDMPERRLRIDGLPHPFDNPERKAHIEAHSGGSQSWIDAAYEMTEGIPSLICCKDDDLAEYETKEEFLDRLGLLTDTERKALEKG